MPLLIAMWISYAHFSGEYDAPTPNENATRAPLTGIQLARGALPHNIIPVH
jgi:hypothetical protein